LTDKAQTSQEKVSKELTIDEAARHLPRGEAQLEITDSARELDNETATKPGEFPPSSKEKVVPAPPLDPDIQAVRAIALVMTTSQKQDR